MAIAAPASHAAVVYWAFGDSVTRGEGGGEKLDQAGTNCPSSGYPTHCGYQWRLEDSLNAAGFNATVLNRGDAGEKTAQGVSRIDDAGEPLAANRCTDPTADDVVLIMEGTNDVSDGISRGTIVANLGAMLDKATAKCVHSAVASTIRRLLAGSDPGSHDGDPDHPKTKALKNDIRDSLAPSKNRAFVNPFGSLCNDPDCDIPGSCPPQPCYDDKFWGRFGPGDPGHVDKDGYNVMAPLFHDVIVDQNLPGAPSLTSPVGDVTDTTPPFTWPETTRGDWYFLQVEEADGTPVYGRWHPEEGHAGDPVLCSGSVCSFDPAIALSAGDYRWRGSQLSRDSCEPAAGPYAPTFAWGEAVDAKDYRLQVLDGSMVIVVDETFSAGSVCGAGSCSAAPATSIPSGAYTWNMRAANPVGDGPWSAETAFSIYPTDLVVGDTTPLPFQACETIWTDAAGFTVGGTEEVGFVAGSSIELGNGFEVLTGGTFTGYLY
jgi:lysophospholipase L1-like esterase